ncbi:HalOD1 output domain-containing protein [Halorussus sp. AFM4]|uniref:HalOD1 output domain-containing protein n=1 Tax=Halorussus sp. AFM4 TaxID=3421651 RepID=UPI003EBB2127
MNSDADIEIVDRDPETDSYRVAYDPETPPSEAVPAAIRELTGAEPGALDPLHAAIDPEALDGLFRRRGAGTARRAGRVSFSYEGYAVTVFSDRRLLVRAED